jgi:hypothetical protein
MKESTTLAVYAIAVAFAGHVLLFCFGSVQTDIIKIFFKNRNLRLSSVEFYRYAAEKPVSLSITNSQTLSYMTGVCRKASNNFLGGWSCFIQFKLSDETKSTLNLIIPQGGRALDIGVERGPFEVAKLYGVKLDGPIPDDLTAALLQVTTSGHVRRLLPAAETDFAH